MNIIVKYMTNNDCYRAGRKITPKGIMVHSTATPGLMAADWYSRWNKPGIKKCIHAFVDDKEVWQYLPWNHRGWHAGDPDGNSGYTGFEICEPKNLGDKVYFEKAWANAVELAAYLCKVLHLTELDILGHYEAHRKGYASNHADPGHWFPRHGKSMNDFRADVKRELQKDQIDEGDGEMFTRTLRKGMRGDDVKQLQEFLNGNGFDVGKSDSIFGSKTQKGLIAFQRAKGLVPDGIAGPKTFAKINEILLKKQQDNTDYKAKLEKAKALAKQILEV